MLPLRPGQVERRTHNYKRHGTASLYVAFDILMGKVIGRITQRHRAKEFLEFLRQMDRSTPAKLDLHVIAGQQLDSQDRYRQRMAGEASPFQAALHTDQRLVAECRGGLVCAFGKTGTLLCAFSRLADLIAAIRRFIEAHNEQSASCIEKSGL